MSIKRQKLSRAPNVGRRRKRLQKNNKPRRGDSTVSVPCVGACGGLLGLARGHPQYCDERAAPAFSNAVSGVTLAKCSAAKKATEHAQASATSPSLSLIIALDHLLSGVSSHSKHKPFSSQEKNEAKAQLIVISCIATGYI